MHHTAPSIADIRLPMNGNNRQRHKHAWFTSDINSKQRLVLCIINAFSGRVVTFCLLCSERYTVMNKTAYYPSNNSPLSVLEVFQLQVFQARIQLWAT